MTPMSSRGRCWLCGLLQPSPTTADNADCGQESIKYKRILSLSLRARNQHCQHCFPLWLQKTALDHPEVATRDTTSNWRKRPRFHIPRKDELMTTPWLVHTINHLIRVKWRAPARVL
jgi:hypothetical protein